MIYFILSGDFVKIGWCQSDDPRSRLSRLQMGNPVRLRVIGVIPRAAKSDEADWHDRFSKLRERGEWFRYEGKLKQAIKPHLVDEETYLTRNDWKFLIAGMPAWEINQRYEAMFPNEPI